MLHYIFAITALSLTLTCSNSEESYDLLLNGDCLILNTTRSNWFEAEVSCLRWGGHLTSVNNNEEQVAINQLRNGTAIWIGLNDILRENNYKWIAGPNISYMNWDEGQPNNAAHGINYSTSQNCVMMDNEVDNSGYWNNNWCTGAYILKYICRKYDPDEIESECSIRLNGHCFSLSTKEYNWHKAELSCLQWGGYLTSVRSQEEQEALNILRNRTIVWIGYHKIASEGSYTWIDGSTSDYTKWRPNVMNQTLNYLVYKQACIVMDRNLSIGYWRDEWCIAGEEFSFVCRKECTTKNTSQTTDITTKQTSRYTVQPTSSSSTAKSTITTQISKSTTVLPVTEIQPIPLQIHSPKPGTIFHLNITAISSFRIVCNATDDSSITYSWIYNNTKSTIARSSELSLNSAQLSSIINVDAVYICIATNSYSSMNASITVKVSLQSGILTTLISKQIFQLDEILAVSNILKYAANTLIDAKTTGEAKGETLEIYIRTFENIVNSIRNAAKNVEQVSTVLDLGVSLLGASDNLTEEEYIGEETIENVSNSVGSALEDTTNETSIRISSQDIRLIAQKIPFSVYNIDTSGTDSSDATENTIILPDYGDEINTEDNFKYEIPGSVAKTIAKEDTNFTIVTTIVRNKINKRGEVSSRRVQTISDIVLITVISRSNITQTTFKASVKMKFYIPNIDHASQKLTCGFLKEKSQIWSTSGVSTNLEAETPSNSTNRLFPVYCNTNHFTSFAVLISPRKIEPPEPEKLALSISSCVLVSISIIFLIWTLIIFCCSYNRFFKVETNIIYFNYGLAILFGMVSFLISVSLHELIKNNILVGVVADNICKAAAVFSNYSWLAVYSWTLSNGVYVVYKLTLGAMSNVKVYPWFVLFGWLSPVLLVVIILSVKFDIYSDASENCFPSYKYGVIWGQIGPILFILFVNSILLVLATAKIYKTTKSGDEQQDMIAIKSAVISMCILTPIFGLPWIFLIPVLFWDSTIPVWIFTISCSSLGVLYFLVVFLRNKEVRDTILQRKHTKHDTSTCSASKPGSLTAKDKYKRINTTFSESIETSENDFGKFSPVTAVPNDSSKKYQTLAQIIEGSNIENKQLQPENIEDTTNMNSVATNDDSIYDRLAPVVSTKSKDEIIAK